MSYIEIFTRAARYAEQQGAKEVQIERGSPLTEAAIQEARHALSVELPDVLLEFYREVGDGLLFRWMMTTPDGEFDDHGPFSRVQFLPLGDTVWMHNHRREFASSAEYKSKIGIESSRLELEKLSRQLAFLEEDEGCICLDLSILPCPVVYVSMDPNGDFPMGASFREFIDNWSRVCFQFPRSLCWASVIRGGGVDWECDEFRAPFRLPHGLG